LALFENEGIEMKECRIADHCIIAAWVKSNGGMLVLPFHNNKSNMIMIVHYISQFTL
jgi:hypothetical protein